MDEDYWDWDDDDVEECPTCGAALKKDSDLYTCTNKECDYEAVDDWDKYPSVL